MNLATLKPSALTHICANIILDSPNLLLNRMSSYDNLLLKYYLKSLLSRLEIIGPEKARI